MERENVKAGKEEGLENGKGMEGEKGEGGKGI